MMDVTIVYDSHFGSTALISRIVAATFEKFAHVLLIPANKARPESIQETDLLIVGGSWGITPDLQRFLDTLPRAALKGIPAVIFDTHKQQIAGSGIRILSQALMRHGATLAMPPKSFAISEFGGTLERGELDHATAWALDVVSRLVAAEA